MISHAGARPNREIDRCKERVRDISGMIKGHNPEDREACKQAISSGTHEKLSSEDCQCELLRALAYFVSITSCTPA
jgi:hypothetical protein